MPRKVLGVGGSGVAFSSGGVTSGVIPKENGSGGLVDSALTDNGTVITSTEPIVLPSSNTNAQLVIAGSTTSGIMMDHAASGPRFWFGEGGASRGFLLDASGQAFTLSSAGQIGWNNNATNPGAAAADTILVRDGAAQTLAQKNGNNDQIFRLYATNGGFWEHYSATELLTLSTGGTTTNTAASLLPAGSIIHAVCCRITTTITTATNWSVGDSTTAARFSASNATLTSGTTSVGLDHMSGAVTTLAAGPSQAAAATVRITTTGTPGAGAIRVTVFASRFVAPTS